MKAMLKQKLIHRDISAGNILLVEREGEKTGVLMDLEYTKKFPGGSVTRHTVRTVGP
jgi:Fungal protein kinase